MLKICPTSAIAAPAPTVPTPCSTLMRHRRREPARHSAPPPRCKAARTPTTSKNRPVGETSSQCAATNSSTPAPSRIPPRISATRTCHRCRTTEPSAPASNRTNPAAPSPRRQRPPSPTAQDVVPTTPSGPAEVNTAPLTGTTPEIPVQAPSSVQNPATHREHKTNSRKTRYMLIRADLVN